MSYIGKLLSALDSEPIIVEVGTGDDSKIYNVPKEILCSSKWFSRALQTGTFVEGAERKLKLPEDSPGAFEIYLGRAYTGGYDFEHLDSDREADSHRSDELALCVQAWIFGHKYDISGMLNAVMLRACDILMVSNLHLSPELIMKCYDESPCGSPLRNLAVDSAEHQDREDIRSIGDYVQFSAHDEFMEDVSGAHIDAAMAPEDFPRYLKPRKFSERFEVKDDGRNEARGILKVTTQPYNEHWDQLPRLLCEDCVVCFADVVCSDCEPDEPEYETEAPVWPCKHSVGNRKCTACAKSIAEGME
ncbi:hypothetical protein LTR56_015055 [Elasticomyces elasticus]|nr:hypothetical protein LTR56_015055 [Elasticomyces elasticus]KAK3639277.1 hypothetical protein LTR22_017478 [Elasticomyces elasticus]KAK4915690.1 hypothetical protein LTR49_016174 [Elasticomyces elasticus]KAK5746277.1 hypothetical protein LTS12_022800 [Elasticomyces elasticus]